MIDDDCEIGKKDRKFKDQHCRLEFLWVLDKWLLGAGGGYDI
jgi:hypothetical protein